MKMEAAAEDEKLSLNIMCAICYDFYKSSDRVFSTSCGHLFHRECLFRWLAQNSTCPQCVRRTDRQRVHPVFLNYGEGTAAEAKGHDETKEQTARANTPEWLYIDDWMINDPLWELPKGVVKAGTDDEGNDAYLARAHFENANLVPANFVPAKRGAYLPFACRGHLVSYDIELLIYDGDYEWVSDSNGQVPPCALASGYAETSEKYYTARCRRGNLIIPGKVHPSHRVAYFPYKGEEVSAKDYEVLVIKPPTGDDGVAELPV